MDSLDEQVLAGIAEPPDGIHRRYTLAQLINLLGVPRNRMRAWMRAGLIEPVEEIHGIPYFNFQQVSSAKTLCDLAAAGISTERIRQSLEQLKRLRRDAEPPLEQLALIEKNGRLLVRLEEGLVEPSGQMCFDFGDDAASSPLTPHLNEPASAEQWFESGRQYEQEGDPEQASHAYRQALLLGGPDADVCFNLANVLHALGHKQEAGERYRQVIELDRHHAEAWNNLGIVLAELGERQSAIDAFERAIQLDYMDAHYNLADHLESLGRLVEARIHWRKYAAHDRHGPWGRYARSKLA